MIPLSTLLLLLHGGLPAACPPCVASDSLLARGDTAAAVALLRKSAGTDAAQAELAWVLTLRAGSGDAGAEERAEAETALARAERALPDDLRWLFARAILLGKSGAPTDARRVVERALEALVERAHWSDPRLGPLYEALAAQLPADQFEHVLQRTLAAAYATRIEDTPGVALFLVLLAGVQERRVWPFRHLGSRHDRYVAERLCTEDMPCAAQSRSVGSAEPPDPFDQRLIGRFYERAFALDPASDAAARGHLGELARAGEWERFLVDARRHEAEAHGGWPALFVATGLHALLRYPEADSAFDVALARLPASERAFVEDISMSLKPSHERALLDLDGPDARRRMSGWLLSVSDPLFLTPWNERRLAHLSRVVLAELWFAEPWNRVRGARTDRGLILVRYGEPFRVWRMEGTPAEAVGDLAGCDGAQPRCVWDETSVGIRWSYDVWGRDFLFLKSLKERSARHSPRSADAARQLREIEPSNLDFRVQPLSHQVARFLGRRAPVDVDVHLALPFDSTMAVRRPGEAAIFFLPRTPAEAVTSMDADIRLGWAPGTTTFRFEMVPGQYVYTVEAMTEDQALRAASREVLEVAPFLGAAPMISDLLLARTVEHPGSRPPRTRHELRIRPAADLLYAPGEPVSLYFEIYHLVVRDETVRYRVELEVTDAGRRGILARAVRGLTQLVAGADESGRVRWERTAEAGGDRVPEWFQLQMPGAPEGVYRVSVTVTDVYTGKRAQATRELRVGPRYDPLGES